MTRTPARSADLTGEGSLRGQLVNLGELEVMTRFPAWRVFGTATFAAEPAPPSAIRLGKMLMFRASKALGVPFSQVVWVLRPELGEITARTHFHYLLGGKRVPGTVATGFILRRIWENHMQQGMSRVSPYDLGKHGADYLVDCLSDADAAGATSYEVGKFGFTASPPILSDSLRRFCGAAGNVGHWTRCTEPGDSPRGKGPGHKNTGYEPGRGQPRDTGAVRQDNAADQGAAAAVPAGIDCLAPWIKVLR